MSSFVDGWMWGWGWGEDQMQDKPNLANLDCLPSANIAGGRIWNNQICQIQISAYILVYQVQIHQIQINWTQAKRLFTCCKHIMQAGYNPCRHSLTFCTSVVIVNVHVYVFVYLCLCNCARQDISFAPLTLLQLDDDISVRPMQPFPQQKAWKETKPCRKYFLENPFDKWTKYLSARECKCCPFFCAALG